MKLNDFARLHNISDRHARRLFLENQADIDGHYERLGKAGTEIDEYAAEYLAGKLLKPAGTPELPGSSREQILMEKIMKLYEVNAALAVEKADAYKRLAEAQKELAENAGAVALLEAAKENVTQLEARASASENRANDLQAQLERKNEAERSLAERAVKAENELSETKKQFEDKEYLMQQEIEQLRNRKWYQLLFKKNKEEK